MSPTELLDLDTSVVEALTEAHEMRWGHIEELLAIIAEELDHLIRVTVIANSDPKKAPKFGAPYRYGGRPAPETKPGLDRHKLRRTLLAPRR